MEPFSKTGNGVPVFLDNIQAVQADALLEAAATCNRRYLRTKSLVALNLRDELTAEANKLKPKNNHAQTDQKS